MGYAQSVSEWLSGDKRVKNIKVGDKNTQNIC